MNADLRAAGAGRGGRFGLPWERSAGVYPGSWEEASEAASCRKSGWRPLKGENEGAAAQGGSSGEVQVRAEALEGGPWEAEGAVWARPVPAPGTQCKADAGKAGVDMVLPSSPLFYIFKVSHFLYFHIRHPCSPYTKS